MDLYLIYVFVILKLRKEYLYYVHVYNMYICICGHESHPLCIRVILTRVANLFAWCLDTRVRYKSHDNSS